VTRLVGGYISLEHRGISDLIRYHVTQAAAEREKDIRIKELVDKNKKLRHDALLAERRLIDATVRDRKRSSPVVLEAARGTVAPTHTLSLV
jgi:hypothetical protein